MGQGVEDSSGEMERVSATCSTQARGAGAPGSCRRREVGGGSSLAVIRGCGTTVADGALGRWGGSDTFSTKVKVKVMRPEAWIKETLPPCRTNRPTLLPCPP